MTEIPFVQARWYTPVPSRTINFIVLHDAEAPEKGTTAESVVNYFHTVERKASAHYCHDNNSTAQAVRDHDVAYGAPGLNNDGLHFEHAGYASQTRADWLDTYSLAMLHISAAFTAKKLAELGLPARYCTAADLTEFRRTKNPNLRGITTHRQGSLAFQPGGHNDPGANFPMDVYLDLVRDPSNPQTPPPPETDMNADIQQVIDLINTNDPRPKVVRDDTDDKVYVLSAAPLGKQHVDRALLTGLYLSGIVQPDPNNQPQKVAHGFLVMLPTTP